MFTRIVLTACCLALLASTAVSAPKYRLNKAGTQVTRVSGLAPKAYCFPAKIAGPIVDRQFAAGGILLQSITIEEPSGERTFINVDLSELENASKIDHDLIIRSLQLLTRKGRSVKAGIVACGAAGRVMVLDWLS